MSKIKETIQQGISSEIETREVNDMKLKTGNVYKSIVIIGKRANQISKDQKEELHSKLAEFASTSDNLEEIFENREQIEISRFYERMPNAALLATQEFMDDGIYYRDAAAEAEEEDAKE